MIYDSRKKLLAETFGENGCVVDKSWMTATFQDLNSEFKVYSDDIDFLYNNKTYCITPEEQEKTQIVIRENNGVSADIVINGVNKGKTNAFIEMPEGNYIASVQATGYISQDVPFTTKTGETRYAYVTLIKTPTEEENPDEYETAEKTGAILTPTMRSNIPSPIVPGTYQWFGWEFTNVGDEVWKGIVGLKLVDSTGKEFVWNGDTNKKQTIQINETKYLWAYCSVTNTITLDNKTTVYARLTKTN